MVNFTTIITLFILVIYVITCQFIMYLVRGFVVQETEINKPWVTETLKTEIRKKFQLYYLAKGKNVDSDWQAYKDQKALVSNMTHTAKLEYIGLHPEAVSCI